MLDPLQKAFGDNARTLRLTRKISQDDFAARCQLGRAYYGRVERGQINITLQNMRRIAEGLGVTVAELVAGIEKPAEEQKPDHKFVGRDDKKWREVVARRAAERKADK